MILVTGGTGFLGSHLLLDLIKSGEKVRAIRRKTSNTELVRKVFSYYIEDFNTLYAAIEWFETDLMDYESLSDAMEGVDQVYHCAAFVSFRPSDRRRVLQENIRGTANIVNLSQEKKVHKFAFVSSVSALGGSLNGEDVTEEMIWRPTRKNSAYSESKFKSEMEVWRGISEGLNAVIINPSIIIGPGNWEKGSSSFFHRVWKGLRYYTLGVTGFVDIRDVVFALTVLMKSDISGERFIVSSQNLTYRDILSMVAESLGKPVPESYANPNLFSFIQRLDAIRSRLFLTEPLIPRETLISAHNVVRFSNHKIKRTLGMEFIPIANSIQDTAKLFLKDLQK